MNYREIYKALSLSYPESLRCEWDNDGIMLAASDKDITRALTVLDVTEDALAKAKALGCGLILSHHPLIFHSLFSLDCDNAHARLILDLVASDIAVISLHTRFDMAPGGLNDALADKLGFGCTGKFGSEEDNFSIGRFSDLPAPILPRELAQAVSNKLGTDVRLFDAGKPVSRIGMVSGGGKDYILPAIKAGLGALISGDITHNSAADALEAGFTVIDAGHFATENICADVFASKLLEIGIEAIPYTPSTAPDFIHFAP